MAAPTPLRNEPAMPDIEVPAGLSAVTVLRLALDTLSHRVMLWAVTAGAGAVWLYTILHPDMLRLITAVAYSLTVMWPFLWHDTRGRE